MNQHALAFKVRAGTEESVAALLSSYEPPQLKIDHHTSLLATAVFMKGDQVVRSMEIEGDLATVSRHLGTDPNIRKVEGQLVQYLVEPYDLADPIASRASFQRRLMKHVGTMGADANPAPGRRLRRLAIIFPITAAAAPQAARLLSGVDRSAFSEPGAGTRIAMFAQGDNTLIGIVITDGTIDQALDLLAGSPAIQELALPWLGDAPSTAQAARTDRVRSELEKHTMITILERDNIARTPAR